MSNPSGTGIQRGSRIHIGLAVRDLERSIEFYTTFLATEPSKVKPDYAKFEAAHPPLNLSLNLVAGDKPRHPGQPYHYGIQVNSSESVHRMASRLRQSGLDVKVEKGTACCYSVQDKVWVTDPDGHPWEVFVVVGPDVPSRTAEEAACCQAPDAGAACCGPVN